MSRVLVTEPPKGMDDVLPEDFPLLRRLQERVRELFKLYGYLEVETPPVEYYELFEAKSGEEIREHMYVFSDAHGRRLVLRPEMTAPIARLVAGKLSRRPQPIRLGYIADCYRLEEPQWGRRRRFYHGGFELFGSKMAVADAEILQICIDFLKRIGLGDYSFKLGHVGVLRSLMDEARIAREIQDKILSLIDRGRVEEALRTANSSAEEKEVVEILCRLVNVKPAPASFIFNGIRELLSPSSEASNELENLEEIVGLVSGIIDGGRLIYHPGFARGLEYYTGFIFEVYGSKADVALAGGGRYDDLVKLFGGREVPGVGMAIGITRIFHYMRDRLGERAPVQRCEVGLVALSGPARRYAISLGLMLRERGVDVEMEVMERSLSDSLGIAERRGMRYLIIVGDREVERGTFVIRDLESRKQSEYTLSEIEGAVALLSSGR